jgi:Fic family protein
MAIGHAHFEAVHPFTDGNGRVGRMLMALQMACFGKVPIYVSGYIDEEKENYSQALQSAQKRLDYAPIVEFTALALAASFEEARRSRTALLELPSRWREQASFRRRSTAERSLDWLVGNPVFTVKSLRAGLDVSLEAANQAAASLAKARIVRERTGFGRNRVFAAEEVISVLARRFGSSPAEALEGARYRMGSADG